MMFGRSLSIVITPAAPSPPQSVESVMNGITENDTFYQETKQRAGEYSDKLDALHLLKETKLLLGNPQFKK